MSLEVLVLALGRVCLALYFIIGAGLDIKMRQDTLQLMKAKNIPYTDILFVCAVALKLLAGFGVIFNIFPLVSALALALFTLIANIIFNNFWAEAGMKRSFSTIRFFSNLAVVGGLLIVVAFYLKV